MKLAREEDFGELGSTKDQRIRRYKLAFCKAAKSE